MAEQLGDVLLRQDEGKLLGPSGIGDMVDYPVFLKDITVQKAQGADRLIQKCPGELTKEAIALYFPGA